MRTEGTLERDIMLGKVEGHRRQGRPRLSWIDSIKEATGLSLEVLKESVKDRKKWRRMVEEKTRNRERTNAKRTQEKALLNITIA
jgi:CRISPR/Cas system-associated exonuclease Cas4 (RecB family)